MMMLLKHVGAASLLLLSAGRATARTPEPVTELAGHWEGQVTRGTAQWTLRLDVGSVGGSTRATLDTPDWGIFAVPVVSLTTRGDSVTMIITAFGADTVAISGTPQQGEFRGEYREASIRATVSLRRVSPAPRWKPETELRFRSGDAELAATLVLPTTNGPHPALVLTHGSGRQSREVLRYRSQAQFFAENGVATLIYDRRGRGASTGDTARSLPFDILATDAIAAVEALRRRPDIVPSKIGVGGFSQGGWVAPLASTRSSSVAFVLVGSAPGITGDEQNDFSVQSLLRARGASERTIEEVLALRRRVTAFENGAEDDASALQREIEQWSRDSLFSVMQLSTGPLARRAEAEHAYMTLEPSDIWRQVRVPVLSAWGALDPFVPAERSRAVIGTALRMSGNTRHTLEVFPKSGHGNGVLRSSGEPWQWPRLSPGYQELMARWIREVTR